MLALTCCYSNSTDSYVQGTQKAPGVCSGCKWSTRHSFVAKRQKEEFIFFSELNKKNSAWILSQLGACNSAPVSPVGRRSLSLWEDQAHRQDRRSQVSRWKRRSGYPSGTALVNAPCHQHRAGYWAGWLPWVTKLLLLRLPLLEPASSAGQAIPPPPPPVPNCWREQSCHKQERRQPLRWTAVGGERREGEAGRATRSGVKSNDAGRSTRGLGTRAPAAPSPGDAAGKAGGGTPGRCRIPAMLTETALHPAQLSRLSWCQGPGTGRAPARTRPIAHSYHPSEGWGQAWVRTGAVPAQRVRA